MKKTFTCIVCPNSCEIDVELENGRIASIEGNRCIRGRDYVVQEITAPKRNFATSVLVEGGELPLCSVRLSSAIPKERIFDAMDVIRKLKVHAPVKAGDILLENLLDLGCDVIATKSIERK